MVAYTDDFCLPYMECDDLVCVTLGDLCDPISPWCQLVNLVEAQLDQFDMIVSRTVDAIPLAQISYYNADSVDILGEIPFDIVDLDTDGMVNLDSVPGVTPQRNGIYGIHTWMLIAPVATNDFPDVRVFIGNESAPGLTGIPFAGPIRGTTRGFNTAQWVQASGNWPFSDTSPSPRTIRLVANSPGLGILEAHMSVFWHSDLDA